MDATNHVESEEAWYEVITGILYHRARSRIKKLFQKKERTGRLNVQFLGKETASFGGHDVRPSMGKRRALLL